MLWSFALRTINAFLNAKRIFVYGVALVVITNVIGIALYIHVPNFAESPGADFVQFYSASILIKDNLDKLYDSAAQKEVQKRFSPGARQGTYWPYIHAPFFTILLTPLSLFSYRVAFWVWTAFTLLLYLGSVVILSRVYQPCGAPLGLALAVACAAPVLYWLLMTGQTTAIALFLWAVAFVLVKHHREFWSTFILGLLFYRAQYLAVIVPLLVIRRRWLGILGIGASCLVLIILGGLVLSFDAYGQYIRAVLSQSERMVTMEQPLSHYITLYGFFRPLLPHYAAVACTIASALPLIYWLLQSWRDSWTVRSKSVDLQWALLIAVTLLIMHHGFVYDLLLLTVPLLLLYRYRSLLPPYYKLVFIFLYFVPYIFLMAPGKIPFNPIQPLIYWLCFEIYRVTKSLAEEERSA